MKLCRVLGTVTSTVKLDCYQGLKLLVVEPMEIGRASCRERV